MTRVKKTGLSTSNASMQSEKMTPPLPGPSGLPCIGSLLEMKGPQTNLEWTQQYGGIYHVKMGSKNLVYLNTLELVQKYLEGRNGQKFLDRPMGPAAIGEGLLFGNGVSWQKNKKAMMKALHTQTFTTQMEAATLNETGLALTELHKLSNKRHRIVKPGDVLLQACANTVAGLLLGGSLAEESPDRKKLFKVARSLQGVDLSSMLTQITLKHPKLREPLSKLLFTEIVDVHGTSRNLQRLIRHWIRQARSGTLSPTPTSAKPLPPFWTVNERKISSSSMTSDEDSGIETKCPRLHATRAVAGSEENLDVSRDEDTDGASSSLNTSQIYSSSESLLTTPRDESLIEQALRNSTQLAVFGFSETGRGEMPFEAAEAPEPGSASSDSECPLTPLVENQWRFQKQMSVNPAEDSILQRVLHQPEFANVTEENDEELLQSLIDMFFGGVTSTLSAVEFCLYFLTQNQDMQEYAQNEIDAAMKKLGMGADDMVTWEMRTHMPYIRACITESLRLGAVTPSTLPHVASEDTEIEGYSISAGTLVMGSIISLHYDPQRYMDPYVFRPQRHIDVKGEYKAPASYRPYGIGARRCVGDQMSEIQLFIYLANILRHFSLKPTGSKKFDAMDTHMRIIHRLKDFRCVLERRKV